MARRKPFQPVIWSPVEIDFLRINKDKISIGQLTIALSKSRTAITKKIAELEGKPIKVPSKKKKSGTKKGKRSDLGDTFFRSAWEANVARFLEYQQYCWLYESHTFRFKKITKGTTSYTPDFLISSNTNPQLQGIWLEVKGFLTPAGQTAIKRFKKYYPEYFNRLMAIPEKPGCSADVFFKNVGVPIFCYYTDIKKHKKEIPNWE